MSPGKRKTIKALGIMNGTSLDAIDYSLIQVDRDFKSLKLIKHWQKKLPKELKDSLLQAASNQCGSHDLARLHFELGRLYGKHVGEIKKNQDFHLVGLHGQTIFHEGGLATSQIGHPGFIFKACQKPVYHDFRSADLIDGGQGAPFAPFFLKIIAQKQGLKKVAFHNLGGISNLSFFNGARSMAFDTGPANILMDLWMLEKKKKAFDLKGRQAAQGLPDPLVVNGFLGHPYFGKKPPKSTGREEFNGMMIKKWGGKRFQSLSFPDQMATLAELTALSLAKAYESMGPLPRQIYFYGGGVHNAYLMERIGFCLPSVEILKTDDLDWPSQALEASTFAFLGAARFFNRKVHLPQLTGAKTPQGLGSLYF